MVEIRLTNTRTRKKEPFKPIDPGNIRVYACGPTVYDRAHLGNARPVVVFDVLFRLLRHVYGEDAVTYVRNFTDVDDKINARAAETGRAIRDITEETIGWYHEDMDALGALRPTIKGKAEARAEPRATDYIAQMIAMIKDLIAKGFAYAAEGHVLFEVRKFAEYGKLSGRSLDDMIAGARVEVAPLKRDPMDFVLWKPSEGDQPGWESPWSYGRPGWHIECSAMSAELLGEVFDIHAGGIDLQFPHHENEIAQSRCAHGSDVMANVWLHNEMLQVEGKKMSKSLGNFFTVRDLLDQGIPGEVIRFVLLMTHYRKPMDWTAEKVREAEATLRKWRRLTEGIEPTGSPPPTVVAALADDLNTPGVISALHELAQAGDISGLKASATLLGLLDNENGSWCAEDKHITSEALNKVIDLRADARNSKDFTTADAIRDGLAEAGVQIVDTPDGMQIKSDAFRLVEWAKREGLITEPKFRLGGTDHLEYRIYDAVARKVLTEIGRAEAND
ncbi:cysteine--tRNA ligase [Paracoccus aerodenitrificans]|uniref:cysteine--tRNA ligase n=1 Tax=Paracoccus aerodenitrificans TaxID=3017781 RepID=UPI0022F01E91|nr:cysteine--tRNA ligase [Paracoccus aerodenitrificans]WBU65476.1 cysteine--tRNA ligase [Paracoccus aerodenitrificans]